MVVISDLTLVIFRLVSSKRRAPVIIYIYICAIIYIYASDPSNALRSGQPTTEDELRRKILSEWDIGSILLAAFPSGIRFGQPGWMGTTISSYYSQG